MNILIYGDNSKAGYSLISGFTSLGYKVDYVASEDVRRGVVGSIPLATGSGFRRKASSISNSLALIWRLKKRYDMAILANPFGLPGFVSKSNLKLIRERSEKMYWWITTCDSKTRMWGLTNNKKLCDACNEEKGTRNLCPKDGETPVSSEKYIVNLVDGVVPCSYEYYAGRRGENKMKKIIPLAAPINHVKPKKIEKNEKKIFYHGAQSIFKGSDVIQSAFFWAKQQYSSDAIFKNSNFTPYNEFIEQLTNVDVIVDQLYSRSYGVTSLLSMQMSKILMVGDASDYENLMNIDKAPVVRLCGTEDNLRGRIEFILDNWNECLDVAREGPSYIDKYHSPKVIAESFLSLS